MKKLVLLLGFLFLFIGCKNRIPVDHKSSFSKYDKLILVKTCNVPFHDDLKLMNKSQVVYFKKYPDSGYRDGCNTSGFLNVFTENDGDFCIHETCVKLDHSVAERPVTKQNVTMFKLKLTCTSNGKTTDKIVDEITFTSDKFVNCVVRQARIKYEPILDVVEE